MRILFCNYEYPPLGGGGGVVNAQLAEELAKRHEVTVLTSQGLGLAREEICSGVRVVRVPVFFRNLTAAANFPSMLAYLPMGIRAGRRLLAQEAFDVINTHFVLPTGPVGDALSHFFHIPNVLSVHGGDLYDPSKWSSPHRHRLLRRWAQRLLRRADRVVGQSRNTLDNVSRYYDDRLPTQLIPLGISRPPQRNPANRAAHGIEPEALILATVGRLVARKAVDQLIELLSALGAQAHLLIIGSGPLEQALREQASARQVADRMHFMGQVTDDKKFSLLNMADLYVSTSQHEGFGLVFLKAMACGLPVVCYDHGGQTDFLQEGLTGHVVPLNDQQAFAKACHHLIENQADRQAMGAENLARVENYFIDQCASRYEALFDEVISGRVEI